MTTSIAALITGGSRGIGLGLATRLHARGTRLFLTGRDPDALEAAAAGLPGTRTLAGDIGDPAHRIELAHHVVAEFPDLDLLINNAGGQRRVPLAEDHAPWPQRQAELDVLLGAPVHLDDLLVPRLVALDRPATVVNVTSGGALVPQPFAPLYSAAKAALHSYTTTLRHALAGTPVRVVELVPPAVATGLSGSPNPHGAAVDEFCDAALEGILAGRPVVGFGPTDSPQIRQLLAWEQELFEASSGRFPVTTYATGAASTT